MKNEIRTFYEADDRVLWITFYDNKMWWCFSEPTIALLPDKTKTRPVVGGWKSKSIHGRTLDFTRVGEQLLKKRMYNGTICTADLSSVLTRING
jgi:hypothetical protein